MLIILNWITIQSIILHSILLNYGSIHICDKLGWATSQSKVDKKKNGAQSNSCHDIHRNTWFGVQKKGKGIFEG